MCSRPTRTSRGPTPTRCSAATARSHTTSTRGCSATSRTSSSRSCASSTSTRSTTSRAASTPTATRPTGCTRAAPTTTRCRTSCSRSSTGASTRAGRPAGPTRSDWGSDLRSSRIALALLLTVATAVPAAAEVFLSQREALRLAFPGADRIEKKSTLLDEAQARTVEELSGAPLDSRLVTLHEGFRGDELLGYALIDVHTVRTLPEAFLVVLSPDGVVTNLRLLAFYEPSEYKPGDRFLAQFG